MIARERWLLRWDRDSQRPLQCMRTDPVLCISFVSLGKAPKSLSRVSGAKRPRTDVVASGRPHTQTRTSHLMAPIMLLSGHDGEIYTAKFSPDGTRLASAGFDMSVCEFSVLFSSFPSFLKIS